MSDFPRPLASSLGLLLTWVPTRDKNIIIIPEREIINGAKSLKL